jgi:hypothetical protein
MIVNFKINKGDKLNMKCTNQFGEKYEKDVVVIAVEERDTMKLALLDDGTTVRFLENVK